MTGRVHSIQSLGTVDGPGLRFVVFLQGCNLRCKCCHNPDTWESASNLKLDANEVVNEIRKYRPYIEIGGGVTFSGGEPLLQSEFLLEMLKLCKKAGIHTCIDTSGTGYSRKYLDDILKYTDLVILDIKAIKENKYKKITKRNMDMFNYFIECLKKSGNKLWIRQVIIPGINDTEEYIKELKEYIKQFDNVEKVELLPYHTLGIEKYKKLNIKYELSNVEDMNKERCKELEELLNK